MTLTSNFLSDLTLPQLEALYDATYLALDGADEWQASRLRAQLEEIRHQIQVRELDEAYNCEPYPWGPIILALGAGVMFALWIM